MFIVGYLSLAITMTMALVLENPGAGTKQSEVLTFLSAIFPNWQNMAKVFKNKFTQLSKIFCDYLL